MKTNLLFIFLFSFYYSFSQSIVSVSPDSAMQGQTLTVTISGQNTHFGQGTSTTSVRFIQGSSTIYSNFTSVLNTTLANANVSFPVAAPTGYYNVKVSNPIDGTLTLVNGFYLIANPNPPVLASVNPTSGNQGQTLTLDVSGQYTHFGQGTSTTSVKLMQGTSTIYPNYNSVADSTSVNANFTFTNFMALGYYNVRVNNSIDGQLNLPNGFYLNPNPTPPVITAVNPANGSQGETLSVTVSGQYTHFGQGTSTTNVWLMQGTSTVYPGYASVVDSTSLNASFSFTNAMSTGDYNVKVSNSIDGLLTLSNGFYLNPNPNPPGITSVSPDTALQGQNLTIYINGHNTSFTQGGVTNLWFNKNSTNIYPNNINVINDTTISANFSFSYSAPAGFYNIIANVQPDGHLTLNNGFYLDNCILPGMAGSPVGPTLLCKNSPNSNYTTIPVSSSNSYYWSLVPANSGVITGTTTTVIINWNNTYTGTSQLFVKGHNYCGDGALSAPLTIEIAPLPVVTIEVSAAFPFCENDSLMIFTSTLFDSYLWSTGDITPAIIIDQAGNYSVIATDSNGCDNVSNVITATVNQSPVAVISASDETTFCEGDSVVLSADAVFNNYFWSNGGTSQYVSVDETGNYSVTVADSNGCTGESNTIPVTVFPNPIATIPFGDSTLLCTGDTLVLTTDSSFPGYLWQDGTISESIDVTDSGEFYVVVTDINTCKDTSNIVSVHTEESPAAGFSFSSTGLTISFANSTTGASVYLWDFGDSTLSNQANPIHTYLHDGYYNVSMTAINENCGDLISQVIFATGIQKINLPDHITIYPNPGNGMFNIKTGLNPGNDISIIISDIYGQEVYSKPAEFINGIEQIDLSKCSRGIYFIKLCSPKGAFVEKIILH